jgi:NADPH:quinone reductase-like Zn-dependent oxidoreductase
VERVAPGVAGIGVRDEVVAMTGTRLGAHAELAAVRLFPW